MFFPIFWQTCSAIESEMKTKKIYQNKSLQEMIIIFKITFNKYVTTLFAALLLFFINKQIKPASSFTLSFEFYLD